MKHKLLIGAGLVAATMLLLANPAAAQEAEKVAEAIATSAQTGKIGDGKIWMTTVGRLTRIRTGEMGADAV